MVQLKKSLQIFRLQVFQKKGKVRQVSTPILFKNYTAGFFDGASQVQGEKCGAGGVILLSKSYNSQWKINVGKGTNTKGKLVGLWALLYLSRYMGISHLQVFGDSSVVISWFNAQQRLDIISLAYWKRKILVLDEAFTSIIAAHTYHENNQVADTLSKEALLDDEGFLTWRFLVDGALLDLFTFWS